MTYLCNAFSLQMLQMLGGSRHHVLVEQVNQSDVPEDTMSAIGHVDTAAIVSNLLGREVPCNRINVYMEPGDIVYVAQLQGGRLPEGSTTLPEGCSVAFFRVTLQT